MIILLEIHAYVFYKVSKCMNYENAKMSSPIVLLACIFITSSVTCRAWICNYIDCFDSKLTVLMAVLRPFPSIFSPTLLTSFTKIRFWWSFWGAKSRVFLLRQIWIVNYYVKSSSNNLSNENINTSVSREIIFQK